MNEISPLNEPRLKRCDLAQCEAVCCFNGVYLHGPDISQITEALAKHPEHFKHLPDDFLIDGAFEGIAPGLKTATKPHTYTRTIPAHFKQTRCVFALDDGRCSLQVAAEANGLHPWTYKPTACWLFPLTKRSSGPVRPPLKTTDKDPNNTGPEFPGFDNFCDCGKPCADGVPWPELLKDEIEFCKKRGWIIAAPPQTTNGHEQALV